MLSLFLVLKGDSSIFKPWQYICMVWCVIQDDSYLPKVWEPVQQLASASSRNIAAMQPFKATLSVKVMSSQSVCVCYREAEVAIISVCLRDRNDSTGERPLCSIIRYFL